MLSDASTAEDSWRGMHGIGKDVIEENNLEEVEEILLWTYSSVCVCVCVCVCG